jgi:hypothetical protein
MGAVMSKRDRNKNRIPDKMIGQEGAAVVIEEAVGEAPRGGRRQRQQLLRAPAKMLHMPMCSTSRSLREDLVGSGATRTSSGEGHRFVGRFFLVAGVRG